MSCNCHRPPTRNVGDVPAIAAAGRPRKNCRNLQTSKWTAREKWQTSSNNPGGWPSKNCGTP
eukprot:3375088-Prorocentrum_lima.AAC.1